MRALLAAILLTLGAALAIPAVTDLVGGKPARSAVPAKNHRFGNDRPVENLSIGKPSWRSAAGLLVVDMTLHNANHYYVENLIIACDFLDGRGSPVGTRGTALRRIFAPGETRISGVEFIRFALDLQGGACRTLSAKPAGSAQPNDME